MRIIPRKRRDEKFQGQWSEKLKEVEASRRRRSIKKEQEQKKVIKFTLFLQPKKFIYSQFIIIIFT